MGLFGKFSINEKPKKSPKLIDIAKEKFSDDNKLIKELQNYLISRRQKRNYPSRIAWKLQLENLEKLSKEERFQSVHRAILNDYRSICFINNKTSKVERVKYNKNNIIKEAF